MQVSPTAEPYSAGKRVESVTSWGEVGGGSKQRRKEGGKQTLCTELGPSGEPGETMLPSCLGVRIVRQMRKMGFSWVGTLSSLGPLQ